MYVVPGGMELTDRLSFDTEDRRDLYEYVEGRGRVREREARRALNMDPTAFGHHLTVLVRDGYLTHEDGVLSVTYGEDEGGTDVRSYASDGVEYTVRMARQDDLSGLVDAIRAVTGDGSYIEAEAVADVLDHEQVVLRHNELRSRLAFVAVDGDEVIGWVHLDLPEAEKLGHTAVLTVGVREEYRGHGVGTTLLDRGEEWARDRRFEKLYNSVPASNEGAIEFLEAHGWETEAVRERHYRIGDEYVDEVMMAKRL